MSDETEVRQLLERARDGDQAAVNEIFVRHRERLRRMVEVRLDWRLQARVDASDVIQDAFLEASRRLDEYLKAPALPLFIWLRLVVAERLVIVRRQHLGAQMRDAGREVPLYRDGTPAASSAALAARLLGRHTSPTQALVRAERVQRVREALEALEPLDREILSLRHCEQLTRTEAAQVLGIEEAAAAKRYVRALKRLRSVLGDAPGGLEGV
jgi:RNA polymerase sigma-70 factor (ECF subfamily)